MAGSKGSLPNILRAVLEYQCLKYGSELTHSRARELVTKFYDSPSSSDEETLENRHQELPTPSTPHSAAARPEPIKAQAGKSVSTRPGAVPLEGARHPHASKDTTKKSWADMMSDSESNEED
jgi:hypothetical protein